MSCPASKKVSKSANTWISGAAVLAAVLPNSCGDGRLRLYAGLGVSGRFSDSGAQVYLRGKKYGPAVSRWLPGRAQIFQISYARLLNHNFAQIPLTSIPKAEILFTEYSFFDIGIAMRYKSNECNILRTGP
jgi:hypothetical protein